jgi:sugar phosphate isomerase/epimerase
MNLELGFFTRPWRAFSADEMMAGIAASGAKLVGYIGYKQIPTLGRDAPPEEILAWNDLLARHGLATSCHLPRVPLTLSDGEFVAAWEREIAVAEQVGARYLFAGAPREASDWERYAALTRRAADAAQRQGKLLVVKPHGGLVNTTRDCLDLARRVDHPALRISYDAGNILYYTGADPYDGLAELAPYVAHVCIKDCVRGGTPEKSVDVQPGKGDVDFRRVLAVLRDAGFSGHGIVETLADGSLAEINRQAQETAAFIREIVAGA